MTEALPDLTRAPTRIEHMLAPLLKPLRPRASEWCAHRDHAHRLWSVPAEALAAEWTPEVVTIIEQANPKLPGEAFSPEILRQACEIGWRQLWLAKREDGSLLGLGVTGIRRPEDDRGRTCELMLTAGVAHREWAWMLEVIELWACQQRCARVRIVGRAGWKRRLPPQYRIVGTHGARGLVFERALSHG